ncbi:hypothetical protein BDD12DRAFT_832199 [Trichophaea hybrida]|nr:hypothetical protein BDD12DRAFT_832199 [Trichophaea hybrida]
MSGHALTTRLPSRPKHRPLTLRRVLLFLSRLQAHLNAHQKTRAILFFTTFVFHFTLCPPTSITPDAAGTLSPHISATLLLWTLFALLSTGPWCTANIIVPLWISLAFRSSFSILETLGQANSPTIAFLLMVVWAGGVWAWISAPWVKAYSSGKWESEEGRKEFCETLDALLDMHEASVRGFSTHMLTWLLATINERGGLLLRQYGGMVPGGKKSRWTAAQLKIFRPSPVETREAMIPLFDDFLEAARVSIKGMRDGVNMLESQVVVNVGRDLGDKKHKVVFLMKTTLDLWDGLYVELMHPEGKGETQRPEVGDVLPTRIWRPIAWFMAVEEKGMEVVTVERGDNCY